MGLLIKPLNSPPVLDFKRFNAISRNTSVPELTASVKNIIRRSKSCCKVNKQQIPLVHNQKPQP
jgi:hypothetical protein